MIEETLTYNDLHISSSDVYEALGYGSFVPDADTRKEIRELSDRIAFVLRPRFCFFVTRGGVDAERETLTVENPQTDTSSTFHIGKIIARQLRGSEAFAFFAATAGTSFELFQRVLRQEDDLVKTYIADCLGSVIAEKMADRMEAALESFLRGTDSKHTNRFSPGYCGWHVSEQHELFSLFPVSHPCGIQLTESSLMIPIKSVSGVIGIGRDVRKLEYTCGLCNAENCYRRKRPAHR